MSDNHAGSVNKGIDIQEFSVSYCSLDAVVQMLLQLRPMPFMAKLDVKHAFRLCPVRPEEWGLLCFTWLGSFYFDSRLPFGVRSSPFIFRTLLQTLCFGLFPSLSLSLSR